MQHPIASLGGFVFAPAIGSYEELERTWSFIWAKPDPIGSAPVKQWMGPGDQEIRITGGIWPELQPEGTWKIEELAATAGRGRPLPFLLGSGRALGLWCVEEISKRDTLIENWGIPGAIEFDITMTKD